MEIITKFVERGFIYHFFDHHGIKHHLDVLKVFEDIHGQEIKDEQLLIARDLIAIHDGLDYKYPEVISHNKKCWKKWDCLILLRWQKE